MLRIFDYTSSFIHCCRTHLQLVNQLYSSCISLKSASSLVIEPLSVPLLHDSTMSISSIIYAPHLYSESRSMLLKSLISNDMMHNSVDIVSYNRCLTSSLIGIFQVFMVESLNDFPVRVWLSRVVDVKDLTHLLVKTKRSSL